MKSELGFVVSALVIVATSTAIVFASADTGESSDNGDRTKALDEGHVHRRRHFVVEQRKLRVCPAVVRCYNLFFLGSILTTVRCTKDEQCWLRGGGRCCRVSNNPFQGCCAVRGPRTTTAAPTTTPAPTKRPPCCRNWRCCRFGFRPCCQSGRYGRDRRHQSGVGLLNDNLAPVP